MNQSMDMDMEIDDDDLNDQLIHLQSLFSPLPSSPLFYLENGRPAAPVFHRGRFYNLYATRREARLRRRQGLFLFQQQTPPPSIKKRSSSIILEETGHSHLFQRIGGNAIPTSSLVPREYRKGNVSPLLGYNTPTKLKSQRGENELYKSVPDFSAMRKENRKPVSRSPHGLTPPKVPVRGEGLQRDRSLRKEKDGGEVSRSYADFKEAKELPTPIRLQRVREEILMRRNRDTRIAGFSGRV